MANLHALLVALGDREKGEALLRESLVEYRRISGPPRWEMGATLTELGVTALGKNQLDEAHKFLLEGEQIHRQTLGDEIPMSLLIW